MSYYIELSFHKDLVEESEVFTKAMDFCKNQYENYMYKNIDDNIIYMPGYDHFSEDIALWDLSKGDRVFLNNLFNYKFIYWKKYKLLAVLGSFEKTDSNYEDIVFQNSCDKDYEYDYWDIFINNDKCRKDFKDLVENACNNTLSQEAINEIIERFDEIDDYYVRTYVTGIIEELLDIDNYMYRNSSENFITFTFGYNLIDTVKVMTTAIQAIHKFLKGE